MAYDTPLCNTAPAKPQLRDHQRGRTRSAAEIHEETRRTCDALRCRAAFHELHARALRLEREIAEGRPALNLLKDRNAEAYHTRSAKLCKMEAELASTRAQIELWHGANENPDW